MFVAIIAAELLRSVRRNIPQKMRYRLISISQRFYRNPRKKKNGKKENAVISETASISQPVFMKIVYVIQCVECR